MRTYHRDTPGDILARKTPCGLRVLPPIFTARPPAIWRIELPSQEKRAEHAARLDIHWCRRCFPETD